MFRGLLSAAVFIAAIAGLAQEPARTGPQTEKRFPPLKVPAGFKATLFACDPLIEYPSVIAAGPDAKSLFVAIDYVTGLGEDIIRRDEIRLIEDANGDGYADTAAAYAKGFNSIQGLAFHDGSLFVMHAPFLTVLKKGGTERTDLLTGLGHAPEQNLTRLHCANGITVGHDGWLYLAVGDHGIDVKRPEGDRLVLHGGGILRCRPDGRDLHVFASGLRNIYDVALDAELNVFVRDNENDGGKYKIRVCHSFFGTDHGYPYLYTDHPDEALPPIADLNLGSSAGGVCYLERALPPEYHGNLFFCEWGRSVVRYVPKAAGSGFGPVKELEFAVGAENDPYGFKPTDIVVQRDGALVVSDWADGQRPKRGRGRIYRITSTEPPKDDSPTGLDSQSHYERTDAQREIERRGLKTLDPSRLGPYGRMHHVWVQAHLKGSEAIEELFGIAESNADERVRVQAIRAIADLADPVLVKHRLDASAGDAAHAQRLAKLVDGSDPALVREVIVALGRLRWNGSPEWLAKREGAIDAPLAHAAMQAFRRSDNWPAVLKLLDRPNGDVFRAIALRALAEQYEPTVVDGLIERVKSEPNASRRQAYLALLVRVHRKPGQYVYWGYRPPPRPANAVDWERTRHIWAALHRALDDDDDGVRVAVLKLMQREKVPTDPASAMLFLKREERGEEAVSLILDVLGGAPYETTFSMLYLVVVDRKHAIPNRLRALSMYAKGMVDPKYIGSLIALIRELEEGPVLAESLRLLGRFPAAKPAAFLTAHLESRSPAIRAAVIETLAELKAPEANTVALKLLADGNPAVRRLAAVAAGKLAVKEAAEPLLKLAKDPDAGIRAASLVALRQLKNPLAAKQAVAALDDRITQLAALEFLRDQGGPEHAAAVAALAKGTPPADVMTAAIQTLDSWKATKTVAEIHGASGMLVRWSVSGAVAERDIAATVERLAMPGAIPASWRSQFATGLDGRVQFGSAGVHLAAIDVAVPESAGVEFLLTGAQEVWLNGKSIHRRAEKSTGTVRFSGELVKGDNRVLVLASTAECQMGFRRKSATAALEKLAQAALVRTGDIERGRRIFFNAEKSLCMKCHRIGDQGEKVGPELTGIGTRFGRVHLIESILEPSRTVVAGFATLRVETADGRVLTGVKAAETETAITLVDSEVKKHELKKADIASQKPVTTSAMPDGFEKRLTEQEFVDLIAFLVSQKDRTATLPGRAP